MRRGRFVIAWVLMVAIVLTNVNYVKADTSSDIIASGNWRGMDWVIDGDGLLTISGVYDYGGDEIKSPAWLDSYYLIYSINRVSVTAEGVKSTYAWFNRCSDLVSIDVSEFDTSHVTDMSWMFCGCVSLKELDVSGFDTSHVINMSGMFEDCRCLNDLDISGFDTSHVTNMCRMFNGCSGMQTLNISGFNTSQVADMSSMFCGCSSLTELDVSEFDTSFVTDMSGMFKDCQYLTELDVSEFNTSYVTYMGGMFENCSRLTNLDVSHFATRNVISMAGMFEGCCGLTNLDVSHFDTVSVTDMQYMFEECIELTSLDVSRFDTSRAKDMNCMFKSCSSLIELDVSGFDTSQVTNMQGMFEYCSNLTELDVSHFDTGNVTEMSDMFYGCSKLTVLNVSNFDTTKTQRMGYMFTGCGAKRIKIFRDLSWSSVVLPIFPMYDVRANEYTYFPTGLSESIWLYAEKPELVSEDQFRIYVKDSAIGESILNAHIFVDSVDYESTENGYITLPADSQDTTEHTIYAYADGYIQKPYQQLQIKGGESYTFYLEKKASTQDPSEPKASSDFDATTYHASFVYDGFSTNINSQFYGETPSSALYKNAKDSGLVNTTQIWRLFQDTLSSIDDPSKLMDMPCRKQDVYEGIIFSLFESSSQLSDYSYNTREIKDIKSILSVIKENAKAQYGINIAENNDLSSLTREQRLKLGEMTEACFKDEWKNSVQTKDVSDIFDAITYIDDFLEYIEYMANCYMLCELSGEYKAILQDMYISCPSDNLELQMALLDCIKTMDMSEDQLLAKMKVHGVAVAGKKAVQAGISELWSSAKQNLVSTNPYVALFWVSYKTSNFLTKAVYNSDATAENLMKIEASLDIRQLVLKSYELERENFLSQKNEAAAAKYLASLEIGFRYLNEDCKVANSFTDANAQSLVAQIDVLLGSKTYEKRRYIINEYKKGYSALNDSVDTAWIDGLTEEYPDEYQKYKSLLNGSGTRTTKHYLIACPVDVYVYDQQGELAGSVVGSSVFCREGEPLTIMVVDERKEIFFYGDSEEYSIQYVGTDEGTMDISIEEYNEEQQISREVKHQDIPLNVNSVYLSVDTPMNHNTYELEGGVTSQILSPTADSEKEQNSYTLTVKGGYMANVTDMGAMTQCATGEKVMVYATLYDGYTFKGWSSNVGDSVFSDKSSWATEITMPARNLEVTAIVEQTLPVGEIERILSGKGSITVTGWAYDPNQSEEALMIYAYIGGEAGEAGVQKYEIGTTDISREDINQAEGITGIHGFSETVPIEQTEDTLIYFYAVDKDTGVEHYIGHKVAAIKSAVEALLGDINGDGEVNAKDRMYLARALAGWDGYTVPGVELADFNEDGKVDAKDRMYLARKVAGWDGYQ